MKENVAFYDIPLFIKGVGRLEGCFTDEKGLPFLFF